MKITKVDVFMLDAGSQRWQRKPIVCRIYTDEGIYGDGEPVSHSESEAPQRLAW